MIDSALQFNYVITDFLHAGSVNYWWRSVECPDVTVNLSIFVSYYGSFGLLYFDALLLSANMLGIVLLVFFPHRF